MRCSSPFMQLSPPTPSARVCVKTVCVCVSLCSCVQQGHFMSFQCESNTDFKQIFILRRSKKRHLCGDWKHTEDIQKTERNSVAVRVLVSKV